MGKDAGEKENAAAVFVRRFRMMKTDQFLHEESHQDRLGTNVEKTHQTAFYAHDCKRSGTAGAEISPGSRTSPTITCMRLPSSRSSHLSTLWQRPRRPTSQTILSSIFRGQRSTSTVGNGKLCSDWRNITDSNKTDSGHSYSHRKTDRSIVDTRNHHVIIT